MWSVSMTVNYHITSDVEQIKLIFWVLARDIFWNKTNSKEYFKGDPRYQDEDLG